jgi:hypothetical protein
MANFYLHEDDWGMISLLPAENAGWAEDTAREAERASDENFAGFVEMGGGQIPTYNDVYVIPEEKHPIREGSIRLDDMRALLADTWPEAEKVTSGYSTYVEEVSNAFAFGAAYGPSGSFYGSHEDGIVIGLHITRPVSNDAQAVEAFAAALAHLGRQYDLMLADWWSHTTADLRDPAGIRKYLEGEA